MKKTHSVFCVVFSVGLVGAAGIAIADDANPLAGGPAEYIELPENIAALDAYTSRIAWAAAAGGSTQLIDFQSFPSFTLPVEITNQLAPFGISNVSGTSPNIPPDFVTSVWVEDSTTQDTQIGMFEPGLLPSERNFISNQIDPPGFATGAITFTFSSPATAVGAYVADSAPLAPFVIEVFDGAVSLGAIAAPDRFLPDSFIGVVSDMPFTSATFASLSTVDSWGLDDLEFASGGGSDICDLTVGEFVFGCFAGTVDGCDLNQDGRFGLGDIIEFFALCR